MENVTVGKRLAQIRKERGLTQQELANICQISSQTISRYESSENPKYSMKTLEKIAKALDVDINELFVVETKTEMIHKDLLDSFNFLPNNTIDSKFFRKIPVYGRIQAGVPIEAITDITDSIEVPVDMFRGGKEILALEVKGDSMYPDFMEGDVVILEKTTDVPNNSICAVYVNGYDVTLKQIRYNHNKTITLIPFNREYPSKTYEDGEIEILGMVKESRRRY